MKKMISVDEALALVLEYSVPMAARPVPLVEALGHVLAEDAVADADHPHFPRAMMDGYAVRIADAGGAPAVVGEIAAGFASDLVLSDGRCVAIMTGAPCPEGTQAVVKVEDTREEGHRVALPDGISAGQHISPAGSECREGALLLRAGVILTPLSIATLAAIGWREVPVVPRPALAAISTGSELLPVGSPLEPGRIRNSNGPMLATLGREAGMPVAHVLHAGDTLPQLTAALGQTAEARIVLLSGGVSMGRYDLVPKALRDFGVEPVFHKILQKPGKPIWFGRRGEQLYFGLSGNPLGCYVGFHRYAAAAARRMAGLPHDCASAEARLAAPVRTKGKRTRFVLGDVTATKTGWLANPLLGEGSADIYATAGANALLRVPPEDERGGVSELVTFQWLGEARWLRPSQETRLGRVSPLGG